MREGTVKAFPSGVLEGSLRHCQIAWKSCRRGEDRPPGETQPDTHGESRGEW